MQTSMLKKERTQYGGELLKTRKGRDRGRPLDTKNTIHLVLRSSKAVGDCSFKKESHARQIQRIVAKFSLKYGVKILSLANVGTHLHFHIQLLNRRGYFQFIRAVTGAIAMAVSGRNRWTVSNENVGKEKFWDYRPFTRIVFGFRDFLCLKDYIEINQLEGLGVTRLRARMLLESQHPLIC